MTSTCPRCRAPLTGPACAMCGARFDAPSGLGYPPAGPGYAPYPMYPGMPGPYFAGPMMMARPPSKKFAVAGGIMAVCASLLSVGLAAWAFDNSDVMEMDGVRGFLDATLVLAIAGIVASIFAIRGAWWGALTSGIVQTVLSISVLISCGACAAAKDKLEAAKWSVWSGDDAPSKARIDDLDVLTTAFAFGFLAVLLAAIFCYIGIGGARRYAAYRRQASATVGAASAF